MENLTVYCLDLFDEENISIDRSPYPLRCAVQVSSWSYLCPEESLTKEFQPHLWTGGSTIFTTFSITNGITITFANSEQVSQPTLPSSTSLQSPNLGNPSKTTQRIFSVKGSPPPPYPLNGKSFRQKTLGGKGGYPPPPLTENRRKFSLKNR